MPDYYWTTGEVVEQVLANFSEEDPPCEVPDGVWAFTQREMENLIALAVEKAREAR